MGTLSRSRFHPIWLLATIAPWLILIGCDAPSDRTASSEPDAASEAANIDFAGVYRVAGTTVEIESGVTREINGLVVLRPSEDDDGYVTNFDLSTALPAGENGATLSVEVVGRGEGSVAKDSTLRGTAETQLMQAAIPGVDARFAFLPRVVGPRIFSKTVARLRPDGSLAIEIESGPQEGEEYAVTRTTAVGERVGDLREGRPELPDVASAPE